MDIQKYESWSSAALCFVIFSIITITAEVAYSSKSKSAIGVLAETYKLASTINPAEAEMMVNDLEKALADCDDDYLVFRIKYRIGVIYFKSHMMENSKSKFLQIANAPKCPELIRVSSLNMVGQISRLEGKNREALSAFKQVADLLERHLCDNRKSTANSAFATLWHSALFSRAEIYESQHDYAASISEYNRLLHISGQNNNILGQYSPLVNDRISQLYLRQREIDKYINLAETLVKDYPEYRRTPIIKLELECVKFLKSIPSNIEFPNGSFVAPALFIAYLKNTRDRASALHAIDKINRLCAEYKNTYGGILLQYHYAWLLDALGEKDKAVEIFAKISSDNAVNMNGISEKKAIVEIVQEYSKIQYAIMAGEKADYQEALRALGSLRTHPDESHISVLARNVTEGMQILKREVPRNESEEK
jgi:tetratricopeptide (TPR) repeat protein